MIEKGTIFLFQPNDSDKPIKYVVINEYKDIGKGSGGWLCVEIDDLISKQNIAKHGLENISPFDCWRVTDKYMEVQIQRGVIKIVDLKIVEN